MANRPVGVHIRTDDGVKPRVLLLEFACRPGHPFEPTTHSNIKWHYCTTNGAEDWEKYDDIWNALCADLRRIFQRGIRWDTHTKAWYIRKTSHDNTAIEVWY